MKSLRLFILAAAALLLTGCLPVTTEHPVGTTTGLGIDADLIGSWKATSQPEGKRIGYFHFLVRKDGGIEALFVTPNDGSGKGEWAHYRLSCAKLGPNRVMNVEPVSNNGEAFDPGKRTANIPLIYRFAKDGSLTLYLPDDQLLDQAIKAGLVQGRITGRFKDVHLTAEPTALDAFFARNDILKYAKPFATLRKAD